MIFPILTFGEDVLRRKAHPVASVTDAIRTMARDMLETMYAARGVGLAAEQIGREESICVIDVPREAEKLECVEANAAIAMPLILVNPEITLREGQQRGEEGCLSFPEISAPVTRAAKVGVTYLDLDGKQRNATAAGLLARAIQHEVDHLNGVLLVDRLSTVQRLAVAGKLRRLQASHAPRS